MERRPRRRKTGYAPRGLRRGLAVFALVATLVMVAVGMITNNVARPVVPERKVSRSNPAVPTPAVRNAGGDWVRQTARETGIPERALTAYVQAAAWVERNEPGCAVEWNTLAAIGKVETNHGRHHGSSIGRDGRVRPLVFGPELNGEGFMLVRDTDGGALDQDKEFDRAVGPMQFIPETWRLYATDGNGDGKLDPQNIDDAAVTAARYLCAGGKDLGTARNWTLAVLHYNGSDAYVTEVYAEAERIAAVMN